MDEAEKKHIRSLWKQAQTRRRERVVKLKDEDDNAYKRARLVINRGKQKSYARTAVTQPEQKLRRFIKMLNSVQKSKEKIERKLSVTRDRDVDRALMKSTRNDEMFKILKDLVELIELQLSMHFVYDEYFEDLIVVYKGQKMKAYIPAIVRQEGGVQFVAHFGGKDYNRAPLLVNIESKTVYYWSKHAIREGHGITFINVRKQPKNSKRSYESITLKQYLWGEESGYEFVTKRHDYLLDTVRDGPWIKLKSLVEKFGKYRSKTARSEIFTGSFLNIHDANVLRDGGILFM